MKERTAEMVNAQGRAYGDLIREYRKRRGLSQEELGRIAHVKKNAVGAWEAGRSRPDVACIPDLCRELDLPLYVFFGLNTADNEAGVTEKYRRLNAQNQQFVLKQMDMLYEMQEPSVPLRRKLVRLFRSDLSATAGPVSYIGEASGEPVFLAEDGLTRLADEIIRVSGDSMEPTFHDGDEVMIQHTDRLKEGEIGIFVNADAGYIKEYRHDGLYSHNPAYDVIRFNSEDSVRCIGRVLGKLEPEQEATMEEIAAFTEGQMD